MPWAAVLDRHHSPAKQPLSKANKLLQGVS